MSGEKSYVGRRTDVMVEGTLIPRSDWEVVVRSPDGTEVPLTHYRRHSPAGFSWGYGGSGPADLARSILIDFCGLTPEQAGDRWQEHLPVSYQMFKFDVIAKFPQEDDWELPESEVQRWVEQAASRT